MQRKIRFNLRLSLKARMLLLAAIVFVGFLFSTLMGVFTVNSVKIGGALYQTIKSSKNSLEQFALLKSDLNQIRAEALNLINEPDLDKREQTKGIITQLTADANEKFGELVRMTTNEEKKVALLDAQATWQEFAATMENELLPAVQAGELARARELATNVQKMRYDRFIEQIGTMVDILKLEIAEHETSTDAVIRKKVLTSGIISGAIFLVVLAATLFLTKSITLPMLKGVAFARSVADGNLSETVDVRSDDEIGELADALNTMVGSLNTMVVRINASSGELSEVTKNIHDASRRVVNGTELQAEGVRETSSAVTEISVSIREVSQGVDNLSVSAAETSSSTLELAASIEEVALNVDSLAISVDEVSSSIIEMTTAVKQIGESVQFLMENSMSTASSVQEMDSSIKEVEGNATNAASISNDVLRDAETGRESVRATIAGMEDIRRSSHITAEKINSLSDKAADIGTILSVIDDVTDQTSLLALNAAIIAAQAGENGKGFAVVAGEIKDLAERTKNSTRMIAEVIKGVQEETGEAVKAIRATESSIAEGGVLSRKSGDALDKVVAGVQSSASQMNEIARATVEQAKGSQMINRAMDQVAQMVSQIRSATREQERGSEMIMKAVERMKTLNSGVRSSTREQSKTGNVIARSTESVTNMIAQIRRACEEQAGFSQRIVHAVHNIEESTGVNLQAATILEESVSRLSGQVDVLQHEMGVFRTKEATVDLLHPEEVVPLSIQLSQLS